MMLLPAACQKRSPRRGAPARREFAQEPRFGERQTRGLLQHDAIDEASGLVASRRNPDILWTHNDSGDKPRLFALDGKGRHVGIFTILGAENRDWEDIAIGPGPREGRDYLYIADIGDNRNKHDVGYIYRVAEPVLSPKQAPLRSALGDVEVIRFRYPDGPHDAEALLSDPLTGDLFIVSKEKKSAQLYRAPWPQPIRGVCLLEDMGPLALENVCGGDVSPAGNEVLIKGYSLIYHCWRDDDQPLAEALAGEFRQLPYFPEPQGESVAWEPEGRGYFTLSEERKGIPAFLYFYPRLEP